MGEQVSGGNEVQPAQFKAEAPVNALAALAKARAEAARRAGTAGPAAKTTEAASTPAQGAKNNAPAKSPAGKGAVVGNGATAGKESSGQKPANGASRAADAPIAKGRKLPMAQAKRKPAPTKAAAPAAATTAHVAEPAAAPAESESTTQESRAASPECQQQNRVKRFMRVLGRTAAFMFASAGLISLTVHVVGLITLSVITFVLTHPEPPREIVASTVDAPDEPIQEVKVEPEKVEVEIDVENMVSTQALTMNPIDMKSSSTPSEASVELGDATPIDGSLGVVSDVFRKGTALDDVKNAGKMTASFFGVKVAARRVVFVVDNSNSMGSGKIEAAIFEMLKSVKQMQSQQQFYVIFFSDTAYPLFHPKKAPGFVPATTENILRLEKWLGTVENCLRTQGEEAMEMAINMQPDVIFLLGDGAFGDKTVPKTLAMKGMPITIHTLGFNMSDKDKVGFDQIAKAFNGKFTDVKVSPEMAQIAKQTKRPHNSTRGNVWGLKLGAKKK